MHTFFHGWRRKAGVVTLGLACVVCAAWIRGLMLQERESIQIWQRSRGVYGITSRVDGLVIEKSRSLSTGELPHRGSTVHFKGGFRVETQLWIIPYWWLAIPLTVLSAYLLLWKPRKRPSPN